MSAESSIDALEGAFAAIGPLFKSRMLSVATAIHPELRPAGWNVLRPVLLADREGRPVLTVSEIVAQTHMDKSVVSRQLRDLKDWGLVTLARSEGDARVFEVTPTPEAIERYTAMKKASRAQYRAIFREWDQSDVDKLTELLGRLATSSLNRIP